MPPPCGQVVALVLQAVLPAVESLRTLCRLRLVSRTWEARGTSELRSRVLGGKERPEFRQFLLDQFFQFKDTAVVDFMERMGIGQLFGPQDLWKYEPRGPWPGLGGPWPGLHTPLAAIAAALKRAFDIDAFRKLDSIASLDDRRETGIILVLQGVLVALFPVLFDLMEEWRGRVFPSHVLDYDERVLLCDLRDTHMAHLAGILFGISLGSGPREDVLRVLDPRVNVSADAKAP